MGGEGEGGGGRGGGGEEEEEEGGGEEEEEEEGGGGEKEEEPLSLLPGIKSRSPGRPYRGLVTVPTELTAFFFKPDRIK